MRRKPNANARREKTPAVSSRPIAAVIHGSVAKDSDQPLRLWRQDRALSMLLVVATMLAYLPAWHGSAIWDDDAHLTRPQLRSLEGLMRIWTQPEATQQYYPLVHSLFWGEYQLWGDWTLGYHLVNILLHSISALLLVRILRRLEIPGAWLGAAIFALHPIQVESVAWISELKNMLSGTLYFGSVLAYLKFDRTKKLAPYTIALILFVLGLMSKSVIATLPVALLVVFWWKRGEISWKQDMLPLFPFFIIGMAAGLFTAWVERKLIGAEGSEFNFSMVERVLIAGRAIWFYLSKLFWPADLIFVYPRWQVSQTVWWQYLYPAATLLLLAALGWLSRRWRGPLAGLLFFIVTLFPVLGFLNVYPFRYSLVADHFLYLASLGIMVLVSAGIALLFAHGRLWHRPTGYVLCVALLASLTTLTWRQSAMYIDVETLWQTTIERNPNAWMAHNNLGTVLLQKGRPNEAIAHFRKVLEINPNSADAYANIGDALLQNGEVDEAIAQYQWALQIRPDYAGAYYNLGNAFLQKRQLEQAIAHYQKALELSPNFADAHNNLGILLLQKGELDEAIAHYQKALEINPTDSKVEANLAWALAICPEAPILKGAIAVKLAQHANQTTGDANPMVLRILAAAYAQTGRFSEAVETAQRSLQLAIDQNNIILADSLRMEIELYQKGFPYRNEK
jgi:protein O-mannosyl-transferase